MNLTAKTARRRLAFDKPRLLGIAQGPRHRDCYKDKLQNGMAPRSSEVRVAAESQTSEM